MFVVVKAQYVDRDIIWQLCLHIEKINKNNKYI